MKWPAKFSRKGNGEGGSRTWQGLRSCSKFPLNAFTIKLWDEIKSREPESRISALMLQQWKTKMEESNILEVDALLNAVHALDEPPLSEPSSPPPLPRPYEIGDDTPVYVVGKASLLRKSEAPTHRNTMKNANLGGSIVPTSIFSDCHHSIHIVTAYPGFLGHLPPNRRDFAR
jgi:hypothetical protein